MARCVQTLLLAAAARTGDDPLAPEFLSIEEYLGRNTQHYYAALTEVAAGNWSPERSTRRSLYMIRTQTSRGEPISDGMASRDLQSMVRAGLLEPIGDKRGRRYRRSPELAEIWDQIRGMRLARDNTDPYSASRHNQ